MAETTRSKPRVPGLPGGDKDASFATLAREFKDLLVGYAKQETIDPLKVVLRFVAWGVAGAILIALGAALLTLAAVRVLQTELKAHLSGSLTWVPYTGGLLFTLLVAGLAASRIKKGPR